MQNEEPARVLVVGRSPRVLEETAGLLRSRGHLANASNEFDRVLDEYDVSDLDVVVFGGMVPPDTKQHLQEEITKRNAGVTFVQGLIGIPGVIAAQVDAITRREAADGVEIAYDTDDRTIRLTLPNAAEVTVEALWMTSWRPPQPTSTSLTVFAAEVAAGSHEILLPDEVPTEGSFAVITVGAHVRALTVGPPPKAALRMVPKSATDRRLPDVATVTIHHNDE